ncbi:MAG TPA: GNAT family N-acetyltransferase [Kofleriaceae bacterium]|nr:GNAT family N-acetyltransferase [Kofleriaceae bacterium]
MTDASVEQIVRVPVLETERLVLRGPRLADFADSFGMWRLPEVNKHIGGKPRTEEDSWSRLQRYVGHWALLGFGMWMVREKSSGAYVGEVGFMDNRREMTPAFTAVEVGWVLMPQHHGKGYATEAMRAALAWGDDHFTRAPLDERLVRGRVECIIDDGNDASVRVATKLGFVRLGTADFKGEPVVLYRRG